MKTINEELRECLQGIADNHGVVIAQLNITWDDTGSIDKEYYVINSIKTASSKFINAKGEMK